MSQIRRLYSNNYAFIVDEVARNRFRAVSKRTISKLKNLNPKGTTLLDVGTGYGTFVEIAQNEGLNAIGIEPANNLFLKAKSKLGKNVIHSDLDNFSKNNKATFDFIAFIHVIEHVRNPKLVLGSLLKLLKPQGILYIETPNIDSFLAFVEKENYTFLTPPDHLNLFSKESLKILIDKVGLDAQSTFYTYSYPEHLVGILRTLKGRKGDYHLSSDSEESRIPTLRREKGGGHKAKLPFFDRVLAPILTPLLNVGNKGSFLQVYIQKKDLNAASTLL